MTYAHNCFDLDRQYLEAENEELEKRVSELEEAERMFSRDIVQGALTALLEIDTLAAQEHTDESNLTEILRIAQDAARALRRALD